MISMNYSWFRLIYAISGFGSSGLSPYLHCYFWNWNCQNWVGWNCAEFAEHFSIMLAYSWDIGIFSRGGELFFANWKSKMIKIKFARFVLQFAITYLYRCTQIIHGVPTMSIFYSFSSYFRFICRISHPFLPQLPIFRKTSPYLSTSCQNHHVVLSFDPFNENWPG